MLKMTIDNEEVVSDKDITINEEMLSASSTILNNVYPTEWEEDKDYTSRFYYPQDYSKALIQRSYVTQEAEAGTTIQVNGSVTLTDVDTTKNSRVLRLLGQTSQNGTPTPSSPIPVNVVSGDNEIVVCGKNLLNIKNYTLSGNAIVVNEVDDYKLSYTTSSSSAEQMIFFNDIELKAGVTYTAIRTKASTMASNNGALELYQNLTWKKVILNASSNTGTFTVDTDGIYRIRIKIANYNQTPYSGTISDIMISTIGGTYEPYQGNTYNIDLPVENLIQIKTDLNVTQNGLQFKYESDGAVSITGTASSTSDYYIPLQSNIILDNNTYTFSCMCDGSIGANDGSIRFVASGGISFGNTFKAIVSNSQVYITAQNTTSNEYKFCLFSFVSGKSYNIKLYFQLEKGTKANSYTPYGTTPIELCKIGNYQDYIYKDSDKWYLHKEIGKVVLNGSEDIIRLEAQNNTYRYVVGINTSNIMKINDAMTIGPIVSNKLIATSRTSTFTQTQGICYGMESTTAYKDFVIYCDVTKNMTGPEFITWLSNNNITVYYVLATPTNTEITYQPLISQLNALSSQ